MSLLVAMVLSSTADAGLIGFDAVLGREGTANFGTSKITITNSALSTFDITTFDITIGDTAFNWDSAVNIVDPGTGYTLLTPDMDFAGGIRDDRIAFTFTDFNPSEVFQFSGDIDPDSFNDIADLRTVLFNNGSATPNSVITVGFSNGGSLQYTIPDLTNAQFGDAYAFSVSQSSVVPEPNSLVLFSLAGIVTVVASRRRKKLANVFAKAE